MQWNPFRDEAKQFDSIFLQAAARAGLKVASANQDHATVEMHGRAVTVSLADLRIEVRQADASKRKPMIEFFVQGIIERLSDLPSDDFGLIRRHLLPRIGSPLVEQAAGSRDLVRGFLRVYLVVDSPRTVRYVQQEDLKAWKMSTDDLHRIAFQNLRIKTSDPGLQPLEKFPRALTYISGDGHDASRALLLRDLLRPWPGLGAVVCVPNRSGFLAVALDGADAVTTIESLLPIVRKMHDNEAYPISDQPFWFDGEEWQRVPTLQTQNGTKLVPTGKAAEAFVGLRNREK